MSETTFDFEGTAAAQPEPGSLEDRWRIFHRENPRVGELFAQATVEAIEAFKLKNPGRQVRIGSRFIWERLRWLQWFDTESKDGFRMNDHHVPYYARHFVETHRMGRLTKDGRIPQRWERENALPVFELRMVGKGKRPRPPTPGGPAAYTDGH